MDKTDELNALAGDAGTDVLKGAQEAVDDLEQAGIVAKDAEAAEDTQEPVAPEVPETVEKAAEEDEPVAETEEAPKPDLAAMKAAIDKLAQEQQEPEATPENAELVQLRDTVTALRQEVDELKATVDAQQVQVKEYAEAKDLPVRFAELQQAHNELKSEHVQALEVLTGLYDIVMGFGSGNKQAVVERDGSGSAHDPEGKQLQAQVEQLVASAPKPAGAGDYAADKVFGGAK